MTTIKMVLPVQTMRIFDMSSSNGSWSWAVTHYNGQTQAEVYLRVGSGDFNAN